MRRGVACGIRGLSVRLAPAAAPDRQICRRYHKPRRHADRGLLACADALKQIFGSWRIYALSALKLAAVPLLAYAVLRHVLTNEFALCVLTVLLCMPIATNTTILSYQYGADETYLLRRVCQLCF